VAGEALPVGKTCGDCAHFEPICSWLICSRKGAETRCDWDPSRFRLKVVPGQETCHAG
jgi:hypothetical protein